MIQANCEFIFSLETAVLFSSSKQSSVYRSKESKKALFEANKNKTFIG